VLLKRYPEAVDVYSNMLFNNPQNLHGYEYLLLLLDTQKNQINGMGDSPQKERAIKHLKRAHSNIGLFFARQNMPEKAIKHYEDALLLDYGDAEIHNNLGILMMHQGDSTRALVHFQEAISINPDFPAARQNMEKALFIRRNKAD
jgi:tetratricopeptide (TPR) repeat protein